MQQVSNKTINRREKYPLKILQFGGGNFLRAFVDWMIERLNQETAFNGDVVVVKPTARGDYQALREQDGVFHVQLNGIVDGQFQSDLHLVSCIQQIIHPYQEWTTYLESAKNPDIQFIISNTTEAGIRFNPADSMKDQPANEFPAKLTQWLYHRFQHFKGSKDATCIFLPLELIPQNGEKLKACILEYATHWQLEKSFHSWMEQQVFCNTLVDRIVSGYPKEQAAEIEHTLGLQDKLLTVGEYYHSWIIQSPTSIQEALPFHETGLNVKFVEDLDLYRKVKVRILNGAHTSMVPIGYLYGARTVFDFMNDPALNNFLLQELREEILPTITELPAEELQAFMREVLDRFRNHTLNHQLLDIALNSTSKFKARLLPTLLDYYQQHQRIPSRIAFALAALIRMYNGVWQGEPIPLKDDPQNIEVIQDVWQNHSDDWITLSTHMLQQTQLWGQDLSTLADLPEQVALYLQVIQNKKPLSEIRFEFADKL